MLTLVEIHYYAAARNARGLATETIDNPPATLGELVELLAQHPGTTDAGMPLADVLQRCSFLVDGAHATPTTNLATAGRVDVLPPFAGG
ncbi:MoaD/ThiS family protein [Corynebacterium choanae]|uniref:ThiS family protein n=1 Tax=Corynebacterium choanae TaxID=1862358 RepID=A0A3G6J5P8_9CORY|nr:MoaD/ThiS family protein [Corynebacterium choanae]AZA13421.1 ThiS family protein [Corynebacterium choanae]